MAVNQLPFKINIKSFDSKKYRVFISGPLIANGLITVSENNSEYVFQDSSVLRDEIKIVANEVNVSTNPSTLGLEALNSYKLKSVYNSENDTEELSITPIIGGIELPISTKNISFDRSYDATFTAKLELPDINPDTNFFDFPDIGEIKPIIDLAGTGTPNSSGIFNLDGTINIDYGFSGIGRTVGGSDFITTDLQTSFVAPPYILNPTVTNLTTTSATISWTTNYPADAKVVFTDGICPTDPNGNPICETTPIPANYKTQKNNLSLEHTVNLFNLKPNTTYVIKLESRFLSDDNKDVLIVYPNPILQPNASKVSFTTYNIPPAPRESILGDVLPFEVIFSGNQKDAPEMYYDEEKKEPRVSLKFDFNQPIVKAETDGAESQTVNITQPILNQIIDLYNNTDELIVSKKFIETTQGSTLGFVISEEFDKDLEDKPLLIRDSVYYSVDLTDIDILDGNIEINNADVSTSEFPNRKWKKVTVADNKFTIPASELLRLQALEKGNRLVIVSLYKKRVAYVPQINILDQDGLVFEVPYSERTLDRIIEIPFNKLKYSNAVELYLGTSNIPKIAIPLIASEDEGIIRFSYLRDFEGKIGEKLVQIVPVYIENGIVKSRGGGNSFSIKIVAVDDFPNILSIKKPNTIAIRSYNNFNTDYVLKIGATPETTYVDIFLDINGRRNNLVRLVPLAPDKKEADILGDNQFVYSFNIEEKIEKVYTDWDKKKIKIILIPFSTKKISDPIYLNPNPIKGLEYPIETNIVNPEFKITLPQVRSLFLDMFSSILELKLPSENKYISHLANFGNDNQILISSWENDNYTLSTKGTDSAGNEIIKEEVKSIILKLYKPLPTEISTNDTLWITKLVSNPIIETVIIREDVSVSCPPLRGPNFKIPVDYVIGQSTAYESLDTLIISSSASSSVTLIQEYLTNGTINSEDLNIQYVSGSINENTAEYKWENFIHFSSAKERLDNFIYKIQLIEAYDLAISSSNYDPTLTGYPLSFTVKQNVDLQTEKKNKIIGGFDGFEKFLYTYSTEYTTNTSDSITWPYNAGVRMSSTSNIVIDWYENLSILAEEFDKENKNALLNNIPSYIKDSENNDQFLLFISLLGQHFDIIYYFSKVIERSRSSNYSSKNGIANKLLYEKLKSFNWDAKNLTTNSKLWEYLLGLDSDGNTKQSTPAKQRNSEIWRRILNNLPYLLKHKGTKRAVHALLACYGIPSYNLSILEFGGPEPTETTKSKFLIENISTGIKLENTSKITTLWTNTPLLRKPDTIEIFVKPAYSGDWTILSGSGWSITTSGSANSKYGTIYFKIGSTNYLSSSVLPIFNGQYFGIELSATTGSPYVFELNVAQNKQERVIFKSSTTASVVAGTAAIWHTAGNIAIGNGFSGSVDEFRLWSTKLDKERFFEHVAFPEMVNGNNISSSTEDLFLRLDFDYPKNVSVYNTTPNVDNNIYFSKGITRNDLEIATIINGTNIFSESLPAVYSASYSGFSSVTNYPYQFEIIERNSVLEIPDLGIQRYSNNKIRFENQILAGNTLYKDKRNTQRAFDTAPIDSNKIGLFFSPTKELNIDIAKSVGGLNLDDYIGDPRDQYKDTYSKLNSLREYYFNRFDGRDIYAYINMVKLYEQNLFEDIKQLLPARSKITTGILIEPHLLERSKIARKKPSAENNQYETLIDYNRQETISGLASQYETTIDSTIITNLISEANQYETTIVTIDDIIPIAEASQYEGDIDTELVLTTSAEATQYETEVDTKLKDTSIQAYIDWSTDTIGISDFENYGLGLYMQKPGIAIRSYIDRHGNIKKERIRVNLITKQKEKYFTKFKVRLPNGLGDPRGGLEATSSLVTERVLSIQPYDGTTAPTTGGEIIDVLAIDGYLPTHYKFTQDNSTGLQNSFYNGCKITGISPIDGKPVVEEFISNPGALTVNKFGRSSNEPILEVE